jgi:hypothetical protein
MAALAETEFVCVMDDDVLLNDGLVLEDALQRLSYAPHRSAAGIEGVNLVSGNTYLESEHLRISDPPLLTDTACDVVKGKFMLVRTAAVRQYLRFAMFEQSEEDDIAVSAALAGGHYRRHICLSTMGKRFTLSDAPHALWRCDGHFDRRTAACKLYFAGFAK